MVSRLSRGFTFLAMIALLAVAAPFTISNGGLCIAQAPPGDGGGGDDGDGGDSTGGQPGGILIDPSGVISSRTIFDDTRALDLQKAKAAKQLLDQDLATPTDLRFISLNRLESEVARYVDAGEQLPMEIRYLAGLTRLTHVFFFPESGDIVIGGPAEGFFVNTQNRVVGVESGRAVLQLQDLIVALRAFGPESRPTSVISCSIDPTQEGNVRLQQKMQEISRAVAGSNITPAMGQKIANEYRQALGLQEITVKGISPKTRMAHVLVNADYHMKLIGLGLERPNVPITSFVEKVSPSGLGNNALVRWYFKPEYDCVRVNEDGTAMKLEGGGVKLVGEDEVVTQDGSRARTGKANRASRTYCSSFTKNYEQLAERTPLYAELRNIMDMTIAAAFIQEMDYYGQAGWKMPVFSDESRLSVETLATPKYVQPVVNVIRKGSTWMWPIAGGVSIQPRAALSEGRLQQDPTGAVQETRDGISLESLEAGQWWWN